MQREQKYVHFMILILAHLSVIRLNILSKRHSQAGTCTQHWENIYLLCCYVDEHQLSVQNVCYLFFYSLDFDMDGSNGNQLQKLPNQGKEILDVLPFAGNGNDYLATIDEQKLSVYKWTNV